MTPVVPLIGNPPAPDESALDDRSRLTIRQLRELWDMAPADGTGRKRFPSISAFILFVRRNPLIGPAGTLDEAEARKVWASYICPQSVYEEG